MLENNTFRQIMLIGGIIVCGLIIKVLIEYHEEIIAVIDNIMARRVIQY